MEIILLLVSLLIGIILWPWPLSLLTRHLGGQRPGPGWSLLALLAALLLSVALLGAGALLGQLGVAALLLLAAGSATMATILRLRLLAGLLVYGASMAGSVAIAGVIFLGLGFIYEVEDVTMLYNWLLGAATSTPSTLAPGTVTPPTHLERLRHEAIELCACSQRNDCLNERYQRFLATLDTIDETALDEQQVNTVDDAQARATRCFFQSGAN